MITWYKYEGIETNIINVTPLSSPTLQKGGGTFPGNMANIYDSEN